MIVSSVSRLLKWLNNDEPVPGLSDVKVRRRSRALRKLKPEDMLTWEEGLLIAQKSCSVQMAAICLVQLDAGFRPSEFVDLKYGYVKVDKGLVVLHVPDGYKTGSRNVVAHRCVPALLKWLDCHPTKNPEDPLWVSEQSIRPDGHGGTTIKAYNYAAMCKRLREIARRAGIKKPMDMYCMRHSSCTLDRRDNLPVDLAAERHGHSVKHFVGTYGRLSLNDVMDRFNSHYGNKDEIEQKADHRHKNCPACHMLNASNAQWCTHCGTAFNSSLVTQKADSNQNEVASLKAQLQQAREREDMHRKEQLRMLEEMKQIQREIKLEKQSLIQS